MTDFIVQPNPPIHLSDADPFTLPLGCFHILVLVEPDPESWMNMPGDQRNLHVMLQTQYDLISDELNSDGEDRPIAPEAQANLVMEQKVLWVGGVVEDGFPTYYQGLAEYYANVTFSNDFDEYQDLRYYLRGVAFDHPNWRVAVIGAMYEDDVMRVANAIQETGLDVTVLTRYCISAASFVNLDDVMQMRSDLRQQGFFDGESDDLF